MSERLEGLERVGVKIFLDAASVASNGHGSLEPSDLVPIFHRWIQTARVEGVLIDVADYSHLTGGPGVVLVGHEGSYGFDGEDGGLGLRYWRKQPLGGQLSDRLAYVCRLALEAGRILESGEPSLIGRVRFRGEALRLIASDRLVAPNTEPAGEAFRTALEPLLDTIYPGADCGCDRDPDPRERLSWHITAPEPARIRTLLDRLESARDPSGVVECRSPVVGQRS